MMCSQKLHVDRKWLNKAGEDQQHQDATKTKEVQTVFSKKKKKNVHMEIYETKGDRKLHLI